MRRYPTLLFFTFLFLSLNIQAQEECTQRYREKVFPEIGLDGNISFGEWIAPQGGVRPLRYDVYYPKNDTATLRPLVVLWHGGAYMDMFTKESPDIVMMAKDLARMGYVAISPDYRGIRDIMDFFNDGGLIREVAGSAIDANKAICHILDQIENNGNPYRINKDEIFAGGVSGGAVTGLHALLVPTVDDLGSQNATWAREVDNGIIDEIINNKFCGHTNAIKGFINISGAILDTSIIKKVPISFLNIHGTADQIVMFNYGKPLGGVTAAPALYGSKPVHEKLLSLGMHSEALFSNGLGHVPFMNLDLGSILKYGLGLINMDEYDKTLKLISNFLFNQISCEKKVVTPTGIRPDNQIEINIYPNPVNNSFEIKMPENKLWQIQIIDITGKAIQQHSFSGNNYIHHAESLAKGIYIVKISNPIESEKVYISKMIKQ
ncbi:MAG: T9SS type A sorting domain-containing protein [Chitinophagales bacterium]|nr:T9SS type A sorting domain-containing protein [Chitinophagales bacterium]